MSVFPALAVGLFCVALVACSALPGRCPQTEETAPVISDPVLEPALTDSPGLAVTPAILDAEWARSWWLPRHAAKLEEAAQSNPQLVFLGDSITQGWERQGRAAFEAQFGQWRTLNLGFSGDRTENVLWRLEQGQVAAINPELVVLLIGTNNTGHRYEHPGRVAEGVARILEELGERLPETRVLLLAIFPRGLEPDDPLRRNNDLINARLRNFHDGERVFFRDLNRIFLDREGRLDTALMPDLLHPEALGYERLAQALKAEIAVLLERR